MVEGELVSRMEGLGEADAEDEREEEVDPEGERLPANEGDGAPDAEEEEERDGEGEEEKETRWVRDSMGNAVALAVAEGLAVLVRDGASERDSDALDVSLLETPTERDTEGEGDSERLTRDVLEAAMQRVGVLEELLLRDTDTEPLGEPETATTEREAPAEKVALRTDAETLTVTERELEALRVLAAAERVAMPVTEAVLGREGLATADALRAEEGLRLPQGEDEPVAELEGKLDALGDFVDVNVGENVAEALVEAVVKCEAEALPLREGEEDEEPLAHDVCETVGLPGVRVSEGRVDAVNEADAQDEALPEVVDVLVDVAVEVCDCVGLVETVPEGVAEGVTEGVPDVVLLSVPDLDGVHDGDRVPDVVLLSVPDLDGVNDGDRVPDGVPDRVLLRVPDLDREIDDVPDRVPDLDGVPDRVLLSVPDRDADRLRVLVLVWDACRRRSWGSGAPAAAWSHSGAQGASGGGGGSPPSAAPPPTSLSPTGLQGAGGAAASPAAAPGRGTIGVGEGEPGRRGGGGDSPAPPPANSGDAAEAAAIGGGAAAPAKGTPEDASPAACARNSKGADRGATFERAVDTRRGRKNASKRRYTVKEGTPHTQRARGAMCACTAECAQTRRTRPSPRPSLVALFTSR